MSEADASIASGGHGVPPLRWSTAPSADPNRAPPVVTTNEALAPRRTLPIASLATVEERVPQECWGEERAQTISLCINPCKPISLALLPIPWPILLVIRLLEGTWIDY